MVNVKEVNFRLAEHLQRGRSRPNPHEPEPWIFRNEAASLTFVFLHQGLQASMQILQRTGLLVSVRELLPPQVLVMELYSDGSSRMKRMRPTARTAKLAQRGADRGGPNATR